MEAEIINSVQDNTGNIWVMVSTVAAAISAFIAAVAAGISLWQAREFRKQIAREEKETKILRTFEHSAAASEMFYEERKRLGQKFGSWYDSEQLTLDDIELKFKNSAALLNSFNYVLNHLGRMASAYHYGVIDKKVARELHSYAFVGFWRKFAPYLENEFKRKPALKELYSYSSELFELWNQE